MQSTGQAMMQSSQPVQSAAITVCIRFEAPTMASVGHTGQAAQPMHAASSISARRVPPHRHQRRQREQSRRVAANLLVQRRVTSPPGGQRLRSASPACIADA